MFCQFCVDVICNVLLYLQSEDIHVLLGEREKAKREESISTE